MIFKQRQIRAVYTENTIRVYQAYSKKIADPAVKYGTFVSPPFKMERMTWIKPSFLWMMYRAGWGSKDGQERILALDITRQGFEWALKNACLSHYDPALYASHEAWLKTKETSPVRIQWDPERDIHLNKLDYRSIQIGLSGKVVQLYVNEWITEITDITTLCNEIHALVKENKRDQAIQMLPKEELCSLPEPIAKKVGVM